MKEATSDIAPIQVQDADTAKGRQTIFFTVSNLSTKPIYAQIEEQVRAAILSGTIAPEEELPSIRALAQSLRVSVITTKRAYEDLEREGYIYSTPGKGSFARNPDRDLLRSKRLSALSSALEPIVGEAMTLGIGAGELETLIGALYEEKKHE